MSQEKKMQDEEGRAMPSTMEQTNDVKEENVKELFLTGERALAGNGFTYRHDWGDLNGQWNLYLNWGDIKCNSRVFVAIGEGAPGNCKHMGAARYTLHNVCPKDGQVSIWVNIEWGSPIRLYVDYFVVNP